MRCFKDSGRFEVGLAAALIVIALGCSLSGVFDSRRSAETETDISPGDRLNAFLASCPDAVIARLPLQCFARRASLSLYDFSQFPDWHPLSGRKALSLMVRPKFAPGGGPSVIQKVMIDLEHDGKVDFVIEGSRSVTDEIFAVADTDQVRKPTRPEELLFAEVSANPQLVPTLNPEAFEDTFTWIRNHS